MRMYGPPHCCKEEGLKRAIFGRDMQKSVHELGGSQMNYF
jgi:hypothetical protein